jgi:hypothetical protein
VRTFLFFRSHPHISVISVRQHIHCPRPRRIRVAITVSARLSETYITSCLSMGVHSCYLLPIIDHPSPHSFAPIPHTRLHPSPTLACTHLPHSLAHISVLICIHPWHPFAPIAHVCRSRMPCIREPVSLKQVRSLHWNLLSANLLL